MSNKDKSVKKSPNLRFPEYQNSWETLKLRDISEKVNEKNTNNDLDLVFSNSAVQGIVLQNDYFEKSIANRNNLQGYYIVKPQDFVYNPRISANAEVGAMNINNTFKTGLVSPLYTVFRIKSAKITPQFLEIYFKSKHWHSHMREIANYGARDDRMNIKNDDFYNMDLQVPQNDEQIKIISFLSKIIFRIETQKKTIEDISKKKKYFRQKLFSGEMRFENFSDWKRMKLGDLTRVVSKRNKDGQQFPIYSINNKIGFVPQSHQFDGVNSQERGYDISLYKIISRNTFAYNPARINVGSIGYSGNLEKIIISSLYVCFKTTDLVNDEFLFHYLKTDLFNREVLKNVEGGVRDYLFYENFSRIKINLPSLEEQKRIADFLSILDSKLDLETQILAKLNQQKKYFLQNLFV